MKIAGNRFSLLALAILAAFVLLGCQGSTPPSQADSGKNISLNGYVKGQPSASSFVVTSSKGTFTVDLSKARLEKNGVSISSNAFKDGSFVTVQGKVIGTTLTARRIVLVGEPGEKIAAPVPASAGGPG
jgi:hypothetical protein